MNTELEFEQQSQKMSCFLPLTLLAVSLLAILFFQVSLLISQKSLLNNAIEQGKPGVQQSQQVQAGLSNLLQDVMAAAQNDKDAQAIIDKYGIRPVAGAAPAAPAQQ